MAGLSLSIIAMYSIVNKVEIPPPKKKKIDSGLRYIVSQQKENPCCIYQETQQD